MAPKLYSHPFASYCQKALIALYENETHFELCALGQPDQKAEAALQALWPLGKFPVLTENGRTVIEATSIIEYLAVHHPGPVTLVPGDAAAALEVRMLDRIFDNYIMSPMQDIVSDYLQPEPERSPRIVRDAHALLEKTYGWLDEKLSGRTWGTGETFTLVDCAAAPSLFYADWVHEIRPGMKNVKAYRARLLARPSVKRVVDEARFFRKNFPPGAPDRD